MPRPAAVDACSRRVRTAVVALCAALLGALVLTGTAAAASPWQAPVRLGVERDLTLEVTAIAESGAAVAVWQEYTRQGLFASYRSPSGVWGAPETVDAGGVPFGDKSVAIDAQGVATVVYADDGTVRARRRAADGTWSAAAGLEDLDDGAYREPAEPHVAAAPDGRLAAVWTVYDAGRRQQVVRTSSFASGAWSPAADLGGGPQPDLEPGTYEFRDRPRVAFAADGRVVALWSASTWRDSATHDRRVLTATRPAGATAFGPVATVAAETAETVPGEARMAVDAAGVATFAWTSTRVVSPFGQESLTRRLDADGVLGPVQAIGAGGTGVVELAVTPGGDATFAQGAGDPAAPDGWTLHVRTWRAGGTWSVPETLAAPDETLHAVAAGRDGSVALLTDQPHRPATGRARVRLRPAGAAWTAPTVLGGPDAAVTQAPALGFRADGEAVAIWRSRESDGATSFFESMATGTPPAAGETPEPQVTITTPADGQRFTRGTDVTVDFACSVADCVGTADDGAKLDTATAGERTFTVVARAGSRTTTRTHRYVVVEPAQAVGGAPEVAIRPPAAYQEIRPQGGSTQTATGPLPQPQPTPAQRAATLLGGSVTQTLRDAPARVSGSALLGRGVTFPVRPLQPNVDVTGGLAGLLGPAAGNLIGPAAGNLIGPAAGNLIGPAAGNLIGPAAGNLIGPAAGNLLSDNGLGLVAPRAARVRAAAQRRPKLTVLAKGTRYFAQPRAGTIRIKLTRAGRTALRRSFRRAGRQTVRLTYVVVVAQRGSGLPGVLASRTLSVRE